MAQGGEPRLIGIAADGNKQGKTALTLLASRATIIRVERQCMK
jgi:hypothetical protein